MSRTGFYAAFDGRYPHSVWRALGLTALVLALAACGGRQSADRAAVEYKGTDPAAGSPAAVSPQAAAQTAPADSGGIVSYTGYQAAVAREGDTVASVAQRIGLSASELGAYNGLPPDQQLRRGDELVLPPRPGGYGGEASQPAAESETRVAALEPIAAPDQAATSGIEATPLETAPAADTPPAADGWSPDIAAAAIERSQEFDAEGNVPPPPSSGAPLPPDPERPAELASPRLDQYQTRIGSETPEPAPRPVETITTPAEQPVEQPVEEAVDEGADEAESEPAEAPEPMESQPADEPEETEVAIAPAAPPESSASSELTLIRPATGPIVVGFQQGGGRASNDGVDFASPVGSPVVAAASGEVALVSQSLGGLGTIVLVRHPGDYLTVYGRIDRVTVQKGDIVSQGQQIGAVASNTQPRMHFEVRKGAESLDPEGFF